RKNITIPIVAIGGITAHDISAIMETGVKGIALSGSILRSPNPVEETANILNIIKYNQI
ncbi:MAG TPA: thiamine phosphate synthase, partial [Candidatus Gallibacteroides avistercoris]|nr:thiamine phosphate synthase [Candidatus Gallibacteroides avistercoris]